MISNIGIKNKIITGTLKLFVINNITFDIKRNKQKIKGSNPCKDMHTYLIMKISAKKRRKKKIIKINILNK